MANGLASSIATQRAIYDVIQGCGTTGVPVEEVIDETGKSRATVGPVLKWLMSKGSVEIVTWRNGDRSYRCVGPFPLSDAERLERIRELVESGGSAVQIVKQIKGILK
jgi:diketogulonate reductase-like aldo/keto reductase